MYSMEFPSKALHLNLYEISTKLLQNENNNVHLHPFHHTSGSKEERDLLKMCTKKYILMTFLSSNRASKF